MPSIMADNDIKRQFERLHELLESEPWREVWTSLGIAVETFESLNLDRSISDAVLWRTCQERGIVLVAANRNERGSESLQATIRLHNSTGSLPVITLADPDRIMVDRSYKKRVADKLLDYLFDLDKYLGAGRLYVP